MSDHLVARDVPSTLSPLKQAVHRNSAISRQGLLERLFTAMFDNLVYVQIWEDPVIDIEAMAIRPGDHVVTIASGGCNVLSYLTADPARITAVDLNPAHMALTRLKLAAAQRLPCYADFRCFFAEAQSPINEECYDRFIAPYLDEETRAYWSGRDLFRSRRIRLFSRNIYRHGMLGRFISAVHFVARLYGVDPAGIMRTDGLEEQRRFFEHNIAPLFEKAAVRWLTSSPVSLYGLGIPPAQYKCLAGGRHMADVLRERIAKLACDYPLEANYFARQAFGRSYCIDRPAVVLPPYLEAGNWDTIRARAGRVDTINRSITDVLAEAEPGSVDKVVLLDAQDWMSDAQLNALWRAITDATRPGARVIFRTAAAPSLLEPRLDPAILSHWQYQRRASRRFTAEDRSAIYGGFHLYKRTK